MEQVTLSPVEVVKISVIIDALILGKVSLHELPPVLASFYYLGEAVHVPELLTLRKHLEEAESDRERYYRAACRGGFGVPIIKPQGKTFKELENLRKSA